MISKNDYIAQSNLYKADNCFDTLLVDINLSDTFFDDHLLYILESISIDQDEHDSKLLKKFQMTLQEKLSLKKVKEAYSDEHASWSAFYAFKEIIDQVGYCLPDSYKTVYRGQNGEWELKPSIYRSGVNGYNDDFRMNYEQIYKAVAKRFPENVHYYSIEEANSIINPNRN